jgi:hypothetical protein
MARKGRPTHVSHVSQESSFLNLPMEIREKIYYASLVRATPIDLWPLKYKQDPSSTRVFRLQEDLQFVRREMATGLLTTCKQVFHEAGNILWTKNTFRFSGDIEWFGARRFLGQIGPRALSLIQSLELFAPLSDAHCLDTSSFDNDDRTRRIEFYTNARNAKNMPKMHMVKARTEPWTGQYRWLNGHWTLENTNFVLTQNVEHVCYLLDIAKPSLELRFILPQGFGLTQVHGPFHGPYGRSQRRSLLRLQNGDCIEPQLPGKLLRILPLFTKSATLVIEAKAYLRSLNLPAMITKNGINVLCQPGSLYQPSSSLGSTEFLEAEYWRDPSTEFNYLIGVSALFDDLLEISVSNRDGKTTTSPGPRRTERILRGFGGCRFVEHDEWRCHGCTCHRRICKHKAGSRTCRACVRRQTVRGCSVNKVLVIKKRGRAVRNGVVGDIKY